jgi:hypothetical protein
MEAISNYEMSNLPMLTQRAHLPPELTDKIIDLLRADRATLASCSLVCRSWVPSSRRHLFLQVFITPENSSCVLELLSSTRCTFASSVSYLSLIEIDRISNLSGITSRLPHVKDLSLLESNLTGEAVFPQPTSAPFLCNLEGFHLVNIVATSCAALIAIFYQSPRLRTVSCLGVSIPPSPNAYAEHRPQSLPNDRNGLTPELVALIVHNSTALFRSLVECWMSAAPRLAALFLDPYSYAELNHRTEGLLMAIGPSLQIFRISSYTSRLCE